MVLDARCCEEANTNTAEINKLVMPDDRKNMIKALIQKFSGHKTSKDRGGAWKADFIDNKGEGQIFLLHGSPGVGKTYVRGSILHHQSDDRVLTFSIQTAGKHSIPYPLHA